MSQLDYGVIGNCQTSALVDRGGKIVWSCMPRFDSQSVFSALLGNDDAGFWSIEPAASDGQKWEVRQNYMRNTNVLVTQFTSTAGDQFEVIDFMPRFEIEYTHYRPVHIVRIVRPLKGMPRIVVKL